MTGQEIAENLAKSLVVTAGLRLFREGLVARTWGNVSLRLDENRFVVTPSGIPYEKLTAGQIVTVSMQDLSYTGAVKPSSEKGLHAAIYRMRPDIHAVIHTHQKAASAFSAARKDISDPTEHALKVIGPHVLTAAYALPGTKKLALAGAMALEKSKAALLANHGAVCIGQNMDDAFTVCLALEDLCRALVEKAVMKKAGASAFEPDLIHRLYLEPHRKGVDHGRM